MKICLINNLYQPYNRGGAEKVVELTAKGMSEAGHEVFIISTRPVFGAESKKHKQNVYYIPSLFNSLNKILKAIRLFWHMFGLFDIGKYFSVKKILKKEHPDIVFTHNLQGLGFLIPLLLKKLNIKHAHVLHDIQLIHPSGMLVWSKEKILDSCPTRVYSRLSRLLTGSPNTVISPSEWLLKMHTDRNFFADSIKHVLLNPIGDIDIQPQIKMNDSGKKAFNLIYIGHISKEKGVLLLARAYKELRGKNLEYELNLSMVTRFFSKELESEILKFQGINIIKGVSHKEAMRDLTSSDCLIQPSLVYENSPTVIYEAASLEVPFIASRLGGNIELSERFEGIMFNPGDVNDLLNKLEYCVKNYKEIKKRAQNNRIHIRDLKYANYYKKILEQI